MKQTILSGKNVYVRVKDILQELSCKRFLLVCDASFPYLNIGTFFDSLGIPYVPFSEFTPNPLYEDVSKGVRLFNETGCDGIVAVGGGSKVKSAGRYPSRAEGAFCCVNPGDVA